MDYELTNVLLISLGVANIFYFYFWLQAFSYIKDNNALGFFNVFYLIQPEKFEPIGNKYRIKALVTFLIIILIVITLFKVG